jgi:hypothetical protein
MFPITQLVLELVFKKGRDVIDQNEDPCNKSGLIKARYILLSLLRYLD